MVYWHAFLGSGWSPSRELCVNFKWKAKFLKEQSERKALIFRCRCFWRFCKSPFGVVTSKSQPNVAYCVAVLVKQKLSLKICVWKHCKQNHAPEAGLDWLLRSHLRSPAELSQSQPFFLAILWNCPQEGKILTTKKRMSIAYWHLFLALLYFIEVTTGHRIYSPCFFQAVQDYLQAI